jgi:hypothetical protein
LRYRGYLPGEKKKPIVSPEKKEKRSLINNIKNIIKSLFDFS